MSRITIQPRRALLALAAGLLAAGLLSASFAASDASAATYDVKINHDSGSKIKIVDDESWPFSDEVGTFRLDEPVFSGPTVGYYGAHPVKTFSKCVGDEVRVELRIEYAQVPWFPTHVVAEVTAKLYEGTSCSTTDLDGTKTVQLYMAPGTSTSQTFTVKNDDEGGDYATITLNMSNRVL